MLLAVDIGNSNIVINFWDDTRWGEPLRIETHPVLNVDLYRSQIEHWLEGLQVDSEAITQAILSSVVPNVTQPMSDAITTLFSVEPLVLTAQTDSGITLKADHPERVGADLIADAAGAYGLANGACIMVDFGTATTVMSVDVDGALQGGAICAGLKASIKALVGDTAQLPDIPLEVPALAVGKNTVECMQSGLVLGHLRMVEGLIDDIKEETGPAKIVATGGLVSLLAPHTEYFDYVEPMLTLDGLRRIAERQQLK